MCQEMVLLIHLSYIMQMTGPQNFNTKIVLKTFIMPWFHKDLGFWYAEQLKPDHQSEFEVSFAPTHPDMVLE